MLTVDPKQLQHAQIPHFPVNPFHTSRSLPASAQSGKYGILALAESCKSMQPKRQGSRCKPWPANKWITKGENVIPAERKKHTERKTDKTRKKRRAVDPPLGFRTLEPELG